MKKSYVSVLRNDWKFHLQSSQGIDSKITTHEYHSPFLYPQFGGVVPKSRIFELLNRWYRKRIQFVPKEKRLKFNDYFKKAFEVEIGWKPK